MKKSAVILGLLLGLVVTLPVIALPEGDARDLFDRAGQAYREGRYQQAAEMYEKILAGGKESGPLYYNLGNSYFKQGLTGPAVLSYERARRLMPRDGDLAANLKYARAFVRGYAPEKRNFGMRLLLGPAQVMTLNELTVLIAGMTGAAAVLYLIKLCRARQGRMARTAMLVLVFGALFLLAAAVVSGRTARGQGVIVAKQLEAKFEPRENATGHYELYEGSRVRVLQREGEWLKIQRPDGKSGWIPAAGLEEIQNKKGR